MALVASKECSKQVSTEAAACPHCGAPVKTTKQSQVTPESKTGCGAIVLVGIVLVIILGALSGNNGGSSSGSRPPDEPLKATVAAGAKGFTVRNLDGYDWSNCDLQVNDDYKYKGFSLASGMSATIPAGQFATSSGTRFNIFSMKPLEFFIYCRGTPHGTRSTLVGWK